MKKGSTIILLSYLGFLLFLLRFASQVLFAFSVGIYFIGLTLKTKSILVPALIHGLFNFTFSPSNLKEYPSVLLP